MNSKTVLFALDPAPGNLQALAPNTGGTGLVDGGEVGCGCHASFVDGSHTGPIGHTGFVGHFGYYEIQSSLIEAWILDP